MAASGRTGDAAEEPGDRGEHIEGRQGAHEPHGEGARSAGYEAEDDDFAASELIGERPADHVAEQPGDPEHAEQESGLGHPHVKAAGDVKGEEGEKHRPADAVDEHRRDEHAELEREGTEAGQDA